MKEGEFQECEDAANSADNFGSSDSPDSISIAGTSRTVYLSAPKLGLSSRINLKEGGLRGYALATPARTST
jgi:hypothetical protein